jgi:hypothetical protein
MSTFSNQVTSDGRTALPGISMSTSVVNPGSLRGSDQNMAFRHLQSAGYSILENVFTEVDMDDSVYEAGFVPRSPIYWIHKCRRTY